MSFKGSVEISLKANYVGEIDLGNVGAQLSAGQSIPFATGSGENEIDQALARAGTISAGGTADVDLAGTLKDPGGTTVNLSAVKAILIKNTSESGDGISIGGTFASRLGASGDAVKLMPGGCFALTNPTAAGYAVTADSGDTITLTNLDSSNAQTYEVLVEGLEAA